MMKRIILPLAVAAGVSFGGVANAQQYESPRFVVDMQCSYFLRDGDTWSTCVFWMSDGSMYSDTGRVYWA